MLLRTMSHFDPHRKNALSHAHMWWGFRSFEIGEDCYANPQLLMTNRQSALGQFSIGRVGQFSISADTSPSSWSESAGLVTPSIHRLVDKDVAAPGYRTRQCDPYFQTIHFHWTSESRLGLASGHEGAVWVLQDGIAALSLASPFAINSALVLVDSPSFSMRVHQTAVRQAILARTFSRNAFSIPS